MFDQPIRELACAVRMGDLTTAEHVLNGMHGNAVSLGRADADRKMRRDPPLPQLSYDPLNHIDGWRYQKEPPAEAAPVANKRAGAGRRR